MSFLLRSSKHLRNTAKTNSIALSQQFYGKTFTRAFKKSAVNMGVHVLASKAEFQSAIKDHKIVVLDAFATWCGPCKVISPQVVKFSEEFTGAYFVKIDVDEVPDVAQELGIRAMPTFVIFKNEEKVQEIVGASPKALLAAIQSAVKEE